MAGEPIDTSVVAPNAGRICLGGEKPEHPKDSGHERYDATASRSSNMA